MTPTVTVCPACRKERWAGIGPCGNCGAPSPLAGTADCGRDFDHDPHGFVTARNKVKACDGSITKRAKGDS